MFKKATRPAFAVIAIFALLLRPSVVLAEKPEETDASSSKLAQQVYDSLLDEYRGGETGLSQLELLNNWSIRVLLADLITAELGDGLAAAETAQQAMQSHFLRMRTLEGIVEKKFEAGEVRKTDLMAARHFHQLNTSIGQVVKKAQQQVQIPEIKLPEAVQTRPLAAKPPAIVIDIDATGKFSVKGEELTIDELQKLLETFADDEPESATAYIRAHPKCRYGTVVSVIDACIKAGLSPTFASSDKSEKD